MSYNFQARLAHNSNRMQVLNTEDVVYTGLRSGVTTSLTISASPILGEAEEIDPGIAITRVEIQTWGIDVSQLGLLFPPQTGDIIVRATGERFLVASCTGNEPPYKFVRSTRNRILVESKRTHGVS